MSPAVDELMAELERKGVVLAVEGEHIRIDGPEAILTDDLLDQIRQHKAALIAMLPPEEAPSEAPASQPAPQAVPLLPEGRVGEHRASCPACANTWYWPSVSGKTGKRGWLCTTCFTASLSSPEDLLIQVAGNGLPVSPLTSDPRLRIDEIPERKGHQILDIGNGSDRHHPEVLELDELPFRWRNQSGAPSRVHHHQCPLCGGAQLARADTRDLWYCGTCHAIRQLAIRSEPPVEIGTT